MSKAAARLARGRERLAAGDVAAARREAEGSLAAGTDRERLEAHLLLAACARRAGQDAQARSHVGAALALDPGHALALYAHAEALESAGDPAAAIASLQRALERDPRFVAAWFYLGILRGERGDHAGAADAFEHATALDPRHARAWNNLGNALRSLGRTSDALAAFARAVGVKADYGLALANQAKALRDLGRGTEAESVLREALARNISGPAHRSLLVLLAGITRERGSLDESAELYWRAIQAAPQQSAGEWFQLAWVLTERGEPERAREAFRRAHALDRRELRALFGEQLVLPMIYEDAAAIDAARTRYAQGLHAIEAALPDRIAGLSSTDVLDGLRWSNFFLAYQGRDDRDLQARYAASVARAVELGAPEWHAPVVREAAHGRRIRVGFASAFMHDGTVGRYFRSWMTDLPRERFEVFVYHLRAGLDTLGETIRASAHAFRTFGGSDARPSVVAPAIRDDALDLLLYPELGMDVTSFALAALRLAPLQWSAWGHPVTTGHATIDAYVSCAAMEPADAAHHYTERLLLLPGIGTCYARPELPEAYSRKELAVSDEAVLLLCPQSLFKIHPENDELFARLLAAHPAALLVFFAGRHPAITDRFMRRLERRFAERGLAIRERVRVLPQMPHRDYLAVNLACDAMLDTLHWSGGNTSLDALACGLPLVTLPGGEMRGRQSAAMLHLIGLDELVARDREDYVELAGRLARDARWRGALREHIRASHGELFGRGDAVVQLAALIEDAVRSSRSN